MTPARLLALGPGCLMMLSCVLAVLEFVLVTMTCSTHTSVDWGAVLGVCIEPACISGWAVLAMRQFLLACSGKGISDVLHALALSVGLLCPRMTCKWCLNALLHYALAVQRHLSTLATGMRMPSFVSNVKTM